MDNDNEANDLLLLFGMTLFFGCVEQHANLVDFEEASKVLPDARAENQEQNKLSVKSFIKDKAVEMYAKRGLESLRKHLKNSEPLVVGSIDKEKIKEHEFDVTFQLKNIKLFYLSSFQVRKFKSFSETSSAEFEIDIPFVKAIASYDINGMFKGKKVNGRGDSELNITAVAIDNGKIVIKETPEEIQITSLSGCYDFKELEIKQSGLNIEGLSGNEVTEFLNDSGRKYLRDNRKKICEKVAKELKNRMNAKLKGKNRDQLADMVKGSL